MEVGKLLTCHHSFRGVVITRKVLQKNKPPDDHKASGLLLSHLPVKQLPRSSKIPAGPAHPMAWDLLRRGLANGLHPDASFSRVYKYLLVAGSHHRRFHP